MSHEMPDSPMERTVTPLEREYLRADTPPIPNGWRALLVWFGVLLPIITLAVELTMRVCTASFFDPLPTYGHVALYAMLALFSGLLLWQGSGGDGVPNWVLDALNGIALVVAVLYTVAFLPVLPLSLFAIMLAGLGLCGLSPLLALIGVIYGTRYLQRIARQQRRPRLRGVGIGVLLAVLAFIALELPAAFTQYMVRQALSDDARTRTRAVQTLRRVGNRDAMLRACYVSSNAGASFLTAAFAIVAPVGTEEARVLYYRVTGQPFNAVPPPKAMARSRGAVAWDDFDFDADVGGTAVAGVVKGLSLTTSRLDGSVDGAASLAYLEWVQEFTNASDMPREARAQLALPPGGVVSRVTLWVNDQEREAAFAARGHARAAYQEVAVVQQRDPLLVTTCGPDRVLVQCFPIPAHGRMKIRLGITAPLQEKGTLVLPRIIERNYRLGCVLCQHLWVEADAPLSAVISGIRAEPSGRAYALRGVMPAGAAVAPVLRVRQTPTALAWTPDPATPGSVIVQRSRKVPWRPDRVVFVLDSSAGMRQVYDQLPGILAGFPTGAECAVVAVTDGGSVVAMSPRRPAAGQRLVTGIRRYDGGKDNLPALRRGLEMAAEVKHGAVVWIHGAQPLDADLEALIQWWERHPDGPRLYALQVASGPNRVLEAADGIPTVQLVPYIGTLAEDLRQLYDGQRVSIRERMSRAVWKHASRSASEQVNVKSSNHLARLWASDQVRALRATGKPADTEMAIAIAARYHLVSPVTGAVVLETATQYRNAGIEPVHPGSVPTIPEPEEWLLLAVAALVLGVVLWRKRRACPSA